MDSQSATKCKQDYSIIGSPVPYQKLGRFIEKFGRYRPKMLKTVKFGQKLSNFGQI